jgi:hypothetical protein
VAAAELGVMPLKNGSTNQIELERLKKDSFPMFNSLLIILPSWLGSSATDTLVILYSRTRGNLDEQEGKGWNKIPMLWGVGARFT